MRPADVRAFDGSSCTPETVDGVALSHDRRRCVDLGTGNSDVGGGRSALTFLPAAQSVGAGAAASAELRRALHAHQAGSCAASGGAGPSIYYVDMLPQVGFMSIVEYAIMFLARSLALKRPLVLGRASSRAWTSRWFCGERRSLDCYFNLSAPACCGAVEVAGRPASTCWPSLVCRTPDCRPRCRRDPLNVGLRGWNQFGSLWVSAQLASFIFSRQTPALRAALARRRAPLFAGAWGARAGTIGVHIRGGDSCHRRRYCPSNLTASYFAQAAALRARYGFNRLLLATDNAEAAQLCAQGVLGFDCRAHSIERSRFESASLIEDRVAQHADGALSGSAVALDALADIDALASCDAFVLLLRSCFARVAYALAVSRQGRFLPLVSLEQPWSPEKGAAKGGMKRRSTRARARVRGRGRG